MKFLGYTFLTLILIAAGYALAYFDVFQRLIALFN